MTVLTKKEMTMHSIMNTAINLFSTLGYNATTTALIAREAHVSEAIIFKYYKNKENLLKEISSIAISQIIENISIIPFLKNAEASKGYPLKDFIRSIIQERLDFLYKNNELIKLLLLEMQYSENLKIQIKDLVFPKVHEVFDFIKKIIADKANISDERAEAIMRIQLGVMGSIVIQKYLLNVEISEDEINRQVEEILSIIQKGCI